jgi:dihydroorotate dehydrogenase electron transfer subunit
LKQTVARVNSNVSVFREAPRNDRRSAAETRIIWLNCPDIASIAGPGQFVMIGCGENATLPRPFSIFRISGGDLAILYAVYGEGRGTPWLAGRHTGDTVHLFGPLGNGFTLEPETRNVLLVGGGVGIAPLFFLGQYAAEHFCSVTFLYGSAGRGRYPIPPELQPVPATEDGSVGYQGYVTDLIPLYAGKAQQIFVCGPLSMFKTIAQRSDELKLTGKKVQVSLEVRMGCGAGVCYSCTISTKQGLKQVCKDGPVFNLDDVVWDSLGV